MLVYGEHLLTENNRLEEPCLGHVHGDPTKPDEPNGHALTTTSQLLHVCQPSLREEPHALGVSYRSAPEAMLVRLLSLSPDLSSEGEITPIQAWNNILCRPHFGGTDTQSLRILAEKLRDAVKCHGRVEPTKPLLVTATQVNNFASFGAVIQRALFEALVYETLVVGRDL